MYKFICGINIHVCQRCVNLRELFADYVQLTKRPFLGWHTYSDLWGQTPWGCYILFMMTFLLTTDTHVSYEHCIGLLIPWCGPQHVGVEPSQCLSASYEHCIGLLTPWCGPQHVGVEPSQCLSASYEHCIGLLTPWRGPQHVGVEPSQCLSVSYEHCIGLLTPWCGPQHVGVEPSQCLSTSYEHCIGLLIPWCGPQHVGVEPSQCLSASYEHCIGLLIPWCGPQHLRVDPSQCLSTTDFSWCGTLMRLKKFCPGILGSCTQDPWPSVGPVREAQSPVTVTAQSGWWVNRKPSPGDW